MDATDVVMRAQEALTVRRVVGDPIERDGITIIPMARVSGGGGSGSGEGPPAADSDGETTGRGSGGGYGVGVVPSGAFVIRDGVVRWQPAVDVNRFLARGQLVVMAALLVGYAYLRSSSRPGGRSQPRRPRARPGREKRG